MGEGCKKGVVDNVENGLLFLLRWFSYGGLFGCGSDIKMVLDIVVVVVSIVG